MYKLDRNSFKIQTFQEAASYTNEYKHLSINERLRIAFYLNSVAFHFDINHPPKMDRTVFEKRKHNS